MNVFKWRRRGVGERDWRQLFYYHLKTDPHIRRFQLPYFCIFKFLKHKNSLLFFILTSFFFFFYSHSCVNHVRYWQVYFISTKNLGSLQINIKSFEKALDNRLFQFYHKGLCYWLHCSSRFPNMMQKESDISVAVQKVGKFTWSMCNFRCYLKAKRTKTL